MRSRSARSERAAPPRKRRRSRRDCSHQVARRRLRSVRTTLVAMTDLSEAAVARRVPSLAEERLRVLSRRQPVTVAPGTSLAECIRSIQRTGTGDSVFVCDPSGLLTGVLTERDIFGRLVGEHVDLNQPVESLMTTEPKTLDLDQTIGDAIVLMQTGRYRNVPGRRQLGSPRRRRPPSRHHQVPGRVIPGGAVEPPASAAPAHEGAGRRVTATREVEPEVQELERVTIRFAGDSGDGMQLTAPSSPGPPQSSATTSAPCPISPPRSAPRPARCRACPGSRSVSRRRRSTRPATSRTCSSR